MTKKDFFDKLHKDLAHKYFVSTQTIALIRTSNLDKQDLIAKINLKTEQVKSVLNVNLDKLEKRQNFSHKNASYQRSNQKKLIGLNNNIRNLINFIKRNENDIQIMQLFDDTAWADITRKTEFDIA